MKQNYNQKTGKHEWIVINEEEGDTISCCDCGLAHIVKTKIVGGNVLHKALEI